MLFNQKKFERELDALAEEIYMNGADVSEQSVPELWRRLITDLLVKANLVKIDDNGNIEYTERGYPKINWANALFSVYRIVAYLFAMSRMDKK